ncbi:phosphotransferase [Sutcliffiella horikoshii]|uniref:phosphotransferase enzyme family protein n=1 Tax=Sutcliffiella horikoshii TaxID=79883 RepID=UPI001CBF49D6|nr:phosphotransferase [Sutcliffiella horikoshii]UAL47881.1 phosphotransferase [Sutcliffiella horikoshii]
MQQSNRILKEETLEAALASLYDLAGPISCTFLRRSFNDHYVVNTGDEKYILRVYLNEKSYIHNQENIHFELDFLTYLHSKNVKLCSIRLENEIRYVALFPFAKGKPIEPDLTESQALAFGEVIGKLHGESNAFRSEFSRYYLNVKELIAEPLNQIEVYANLFGLGNLDFYRDAAGKLMEGLNRLLKDKETFGLIHGDPNPSNLYFSKTSGFSLFDFDHCGFGYRIHDLAVVKLSYPEDVYDSVVEGYERIRTLHKNEKEFIPLYADILLVKKFSDILNMLEVTGADETTKKSIASNAMKTLKDMSNHEGNMDERIDDTWDV